MEKPLYCEKHNQLFRIDEVCKYCQKDEEKKAGGIASYYTSSLALHEQYKLENKESYQWASYIGKYLIYGYRDGYVEWLERKLCKTQGE